MFIILINEDSTAVDSVAIDSVMIYEVPEIINFGSYDIQIQEIVPADYDINLTDALFLTPYMLNIYGYGELNSVSQRGQDPRHTTLLLNGRRLDNPLFGYVNLTKLPVQFFESISITESNGINLISKVNHYDRPFSFINYAAGDWAMNVYNIDFTRPITNDFGFYFSGLYWNYGGYRLYSDFRISSLYTNFYYNQFIPMRLDIIYFSNDYGVPGSTQDSLQERENDKFLDLSFVCGSDNHKITVYHTSDNCNYTDTLSDNSSLRNYGINTESYYTINNFELSTGFMGQASKIASNFYGSHSVNSLAIWAKLNTSFKNIIFSLSNYGEWVNIYGFFYKPAFSFGLNIFDSTYIIGTVSRCFRKPSLAEIYGPAEGSYPYDRVKGNGDLLPEYYWNQEFSIKNENFTLNLYKQDFNNRIVTQPDTEGYYASENISSWQTIGIQGYFKIPLYFKSSPDTKSIAEVSTGLSGNYLFKGDSFPLAPEFISSIFLSAKKITKKFTFGLMAKGRFVGTYQDMYGQTNSPFQVFSLTGTIRLLTLSCTLKIDNIFDKSYTYIPNYPMAPRSFTLLIKWEFWD